MEIAPNRKALTHERIVDTASKAIRRAGFQGVGVADIMKQAGLTHGGFYAHFASRDALLAEALDHAGRQSGERIAKGNAMREAKGASPLRALVENYLSDRHLSATESGCAVAALASEMPRQSPDVRAAAAQCVRDLITAVERVLPEGAAPGSAAAIASQLVGALQLARTLDGGAESRALLSASRAALLAQYDVSPSA
ncbi:TetR/AcrR family transcriptional regulator [Hydrogenophaga palleronii]|uniref:TetR/AcrR family transcriptional regulator n=1 Tax=Hydrogenophaga palleronii TaxID=65655 RepID=UPI0008243997|nr:TetR/AcrR family transcriptional regulator [Hydrogenophaga palleronii]